LKFLEYFNLHFAKCYVYFQAVICKTANKTGFASWCPMLKVMKTYKHLKPGQKGTLRLVEKYGDALLCVRYRYDEKQGRRIKTVEIVVEENPVKFPHYKDGDIVKVCVGFEEAELRERLRNMRARWDIHLKVWHVPYRLIRGTSLESRISDL
jgi:hypothetical protein